MRPEGGNQGLLSPNLAEVIKALARSSHHAFVFYGPGQWSWAGELVQIIGRFFLCRELGCGACEDCRLVSEKLHPDLLPASRPLEILRAEGARDLIKRAYTRPFRGWRKVVVVPRAHALEEAGVILLKSVEEPPGHLKFAFLADYLNPRLATLWSRCVRVPVEVKEKGVSEAVDSLAEGLVGGSLEPEDFIDLVEKEIAKELEAMNAASSLEGVGEEGGGEREVREEALRSVLLKVLARCRTRMMGRKEVANAEVLSYLALEEEIASFLSELPRNPNARWQLAAVALRLTSVRLGA